MVFLIGSAIVGGVIGIAAIIFSTPACYFYGINIDIEGLFGTVDTELHGQHLAKSEIPYRIANHIRQDNPSKALVLSLHGPVGVGKSFVTNIVAKHLYKKGLASEFVHRKVGSYHYGQSRLVESYKRELRRWVEEGVRACPRCMFIIEEVHEVPGGVVDVLQPYLGYGAVINGVDYRKAIFFLISNKGSPDIIQYTLDHLQSGGRREDISQGDMDNLLRTSLLNADGGISSHMWPDVSAFVAFLPMERKHVELCARDDAARKGFWIQNNMNTILDEMTYYPAGREVFSSYGCRGVSDAVDRARWG